MASRAGDLPMGPLRASTAALSQRRPFTLAPPMLWIIAIPSAALLAIYSLWYSANEPEMDCQVYRMGGRHILGPGLYSSQIEVLGRHLSFTYPPLAALLFWPISHLSVFVGQVLWDAINVAALIALIAVSIAAARSRRLALLGLADRTDAPPPRRPALVPGKERPGPLSLDCARADLAGCRHGPAGERCMVGSRRCPDLRGAPHPSRPGLRSVVVRAR
jgi:hypothetical protein